MNTAILRQFPLFRGLTDGELDEALASLGAREAEFNKGETVLAAGDASRRMGLVLGGSVTIESVDVWGSRTILGHVGRGDLFAESYALLEGEPLPVDVAANENCRVLFLRIGSLTEARETVPGWMAKMTVNLLCLSARKNLHLARRSFHIAPKTIRGRVMAYLNFVSLQKRSRSFEIPFDRQQLADYLNTDRAALSRELGKMQREGIIRTRKKRFEIV